jgi:hypothetical protein
VVGGRDQLKYNNWCDELVAPKCPHYQAYDRTANQQWQGDWGAVADSLEYLFMGHYFDEEFDVDIGNVTLELAREGVEWICDRWGHVPVFIEPSVKQQLEVTLPEN